MTAKHGQRLGVAGALLAALAVPTAGSIVVAQEQSPPAQTTATDTTQNDDTDFPWGLLGLLGLGGLAGLTRRDPPRRVETVDTSRRV
jgi:MYXO-CTERM domain-containing protein